MKTNKQNTITGMVERMRTPSTMTSEELELDGLKAEMNACMTTLRTLKSNPRLSPQVKRDLARSVAERYAMYFNEWHMLKFPGKKFVKATWRKVWTSVR